MAAADFPNSPTVGQSFTVDNKTYEWNGTFWEMAISTATIADGSIEGVKLASMSASVGDFLGWDGTEWGPAQVPVISSLDDVADVDLSSPTDGDFLKWTGSKWANDVIDLGTDTQGNYVSDLVAGQGITISHIQGEGSSASISLGAVIEDLNNVDLAGLAGGNVLQFSSASAMWVPGSIPTINALDDISDVAAPSPTTGDVLKWSGTAWVSDQIDLGSDTSGNYMLDISAGTGISVDHTPAEGSSASISLNATLNDLTDVLAPSPANGQFLKYSSTLANWVPDAIDLGADTTGNYVSDVTAGTGVSVTHTPGEGSSPTIAIGQAVGTSASVTFANVTTTADLTVGGNLTVNGTTTTLNTETLSVEDNFVTLNSNVTGSPTASAGIEVERGTSPNVSIMWNEGTDTWQFTNDGTTYSDLGSGSGGLTVSSTAPALPEEGDLWFDSDTAQTFVYYDSNWIEVGTIAGSAKILVSSTPPSSPLEGEMWFDSDTGATYVYYSSTWVEVGAAPFDALLNKVDAKGDLLVATSDNTVERLPVGTNGYFLKANSSASAGIEWASIPTINALDDVGDVSATSPTAGYFLQWNGTAWVPAAVSANVMTDSRNAAIITMDIIGG